MAWCRVEIGKRAMRELQSVPAHIVVKLKSWVELVELNGLRVARRIPGYHDEPLKGKRAGQRSIRLSRSYRAICRVILAQNVENILIEEVNKHGY